jgi:hypothetical protein
MYVVEKLIKERNHYFNAFYHDNSLLLQFIITHFIKIHPLILEINDLTEKYLTAPYSQDIPFDSFFKILRLLVGSLSTEEQQAFPLWTKGLLTKLKEYSEQLPHNSQYKDKYHINLHITLHQTWLTSVNNLELLNALTRLECSSKKKIELLKNFRRNMIALNRRYQQALRYLAGSLKGQLKNENILLCLLRGQAVLSQMYGSDFIHKAFKCPIGPEQILRVVLGKYRERGFDHLPVAIEPPHLGIANL